MIQLQITLNIGPDKPAFISEIMPFPFDFICDNISLGMDVLKMFFSDFHKHLMEDPEGPYEYVIFHDNTYYQDWININQPILTVLCYSFDVQ